MILMASVIAISMKIVGVLLITALLIIPAASARCFSKSPEQMALYSVSSWDLVCHHWSSELSNMGHTRGAQYRSGSVVALHSQHVVNAEDQKHQAEIFE